MSEFWLQKAWDQAVLRIAASFTSLLRCFFQQQEALLALPPPSVVQGHK